MQYSRLLLGCIILVPQPQLGERLPNSAKPSQVTAHEWGTFTSVAGADGESATWAPHFGPADLPCFVARMGNNVKLHVPGKVRMETPVIYFYTKAPAVLSVKASFPEGWITEWYPRATRVTPFEVSMTRPRHGAVEWDRVELLPGGSETGFPKSHGPSHYFAARNTDAVPVRVGSQDEKLLFYRGVGTFDTLVRARLGDDGLLETTNLMAERIPVAILFENRGGKFGYRVVRNLDSEAVRIAPPELTHSQLEPLLDELRGYLVEFGLYRKEAAAMIETWRDSWFESGMRLLYLVPRGQVDALLPLSIDPAPSAVARVFVGRVELAAPWVRESISAALDKGDVDPLLPLGRFLEPFARQAGGVGAERSPRWQTFSRATSRLREKYESRCVW